MYQARPYHSAPSRFGQLLVNRTAACPLCARKPSRPSTVFYRSNWLPVPRVAASWLVPTLMTQWTCHTTSASLSILHGHRGPLGVTSGECLTFGDGPTPTWFGPCPFPPATGMRKVDINGDTALGGSCDARRTEGVKGEVYLAMALKQAMMLDRRGSEPRLPGERKAPSVGSPLALRNLRCCC